MFTTVLAFLLTLGVLIVVHEYGHYKVARLCGVKVLRFSIGFGRVIWRRQPRLDGTEFTISALPLGGYVRMLDSREMPVAPDEVGEAFDRKPLLQRTAIVAAGPLANLALAVLLYAAAHWIGIDEPKAVLAAPPPTSLAAQAGLRAGDWLQAAAGPDGEWEDLLSLSDARWRITQAALRGEPLQLQVSDAAGAHRRNVTLALDQLGSTEIDAETFRRVGIGAPYSEPVLGEVQIAGPAAKAGLQKGDRVLAIGGEAVVDAQSLRERIRGSVDAASATMLWTVERAGQRLEIEVTPRRVADGNPESGKSIGRIDAFVGAPPEIVTVRLGPWDGLATGVRRTWEMASLSVKMLGRMLIGEASLRNLSGPLTIADYAGQSVQQGLSYYLGFLALVSVSLGVLNLLPLPMLDGGHLMYYLFEGVTGRPVSDLWLKWLQRGGALVLLLLMSISLSNDVARLLGLQ
ncbi:MAG TPA: RIP metalloprotease RseP [Ideonella sp.]|nr:RIP metalloprotease RseP [Ideonella sp.]